MRRADPKEVRVLAIDPSTRGFGFAVLEGADRLIDWGTRSARENKNMQCLKKVEELIDCYQPDVLAVENCAANGSRRCERVWQLIDSITALAIERKVRIRRCSRGQIRVAFSEFCADTKHAIATVIAKRFPELAPSLPPLRKAWMSEDQRQSVFDAVGLGMTLIPTERRKSGVKAQTDD